MTEAEFLNTIINVFTFLNDEGYDLPIEEVTIFDCNFDEHYPVKVWMTFDQSLCIHHGSEEWTFFRDVTDSHCIELTGIDLSDIVKRGMDYEET